MLLHKLNEHWIWKRKVRVFGRIFRAPTLDRLASLWMHKLGALGHEEVLILRSLLRKGMTVIDAGANQGIYTLLLARLVSPASVFVFEPEPVLYQQLVWNVRENKVGNIVCHNMAVSNSTGRLTLQRGGMNLGDNRVMAEASPGSGRFEVNAASLDDLFEGKKVDFLKADIQGWEAQAFNGARRLLERNQDIIVMFEFWPYGLQKAGTPPEKLLTFFHDLGFKLWQLRRGRLTLLEENALPNSGKEFSYCNLVGARDPSLVEHLLS